MIAISEHLIRQVRRYSNPDPEHQDVHALNGQGTIVDTLLSESPTAEILASNQQKWLPNEKTDPESKEQPDSKQSTPASTVSHASAHSAASSGPVNSATKTDTTAAPAAGIAAKIVRFEAGAKPVDADNKRATVPAPTGLRRANSESITKQPSNADDMFQKEPVIPRGGLASSLSKELLDNGMLRNAGRPFAVTLDRRSSALVSPFSSIPSVSSSSSINSSSSSSSSSSSTVSGYHPVTSALSAQLQSAQSSSAASSTGATGERIVGSGAGPTCSLKVFHAIDISPIRLSVRGMCAVSKIIDVCLQIHREQKLDPALNFPDQPEKYELRMLDDDDGTPDEDMPPLEKQRDFHEFGLDAVALVEKSGDSDDELSSPANKTNSTSTSNNSSYSTNDPTSTRMMRAGRTLSMEINMRPTLDLSNKFFLKVHVADHESHVLPVSSAMSLEELLPIIAKKRMSSANSIPPEQYKFHYLDKTDELDMKTKLSEVKADELRLVPKIQTKDENRLLNSSLSPRTNEHPSPSQFSFSMESAAQYSEYKVIKTNQRGKRQNRILGIDKHRIYNKSAPTSAAKRRISFDTVTRAHRPINSVHSVSVMQNRPTCFQIVFKEKTKFVSREYETETKMEAAEIVAKIRFLSQASTSNSGSQITTLPTISDTPPS